MLLLTFAVTVTESRMSPAMPKKFSLPERGAPASPIVLLVIVMSKVPVPEGTKPMALAAPPSLGAMPV
jgi:hypothetical protein